MSTKPFLDAAAIDVEDFGGLSEQTEPRGDLVDEPYEELLADHGPLAGAFAAIARKVRLLNFPAHRHSWQCSTVLFG